ncbi:hypothetical protein B0H16DRAFT_1781623 [Mycena metata]|uniref:Uncharacterized protein n=1 Tax=Mycena metata TaxID=1033252 RepID=A0AAD7HRI0_9AGAR|nr:hypothetical protein B0H16DRAFT_1781623 [Mycena metata]
MKMIDAILSPQSTTHTEHFASRFATISQSVSADLDGNELRLSRLLFSLIMGMHKSEAKKASQDADHLNPLQNIDVGNEEELNAFKLKFIHSSREISKRIKEHKSTGTSSNATHRQKCSLVYNLQLQQSPLSADEILAINPLDPAAPPGSLINPRVIWHKCNLHFGPPLRTVLANTRCRPHSSDYVCDEAAGFYICSLDESAVFFSTVFLPVVANLAVLCGVFRLGSANSAVFLAWLKDVVDVAVTGRHNVRVWPPPSLAAFLLILLQPVAPGKMVQRRQLFGLLQRLGSQLTSHLTLITNSKNIPGPESLPVMWAKVQRALPKAYLTVDYSVSLHVDPCYVLGACAISVDVDRTIDLPAASLPAAIPTSNTPS